MQLDELISKVSRLPAFRQHEVFDFVAFLEQRYGEAERGEQVDFLEEPFADLGVGQAMRGLEDGRDRYSENDLKERWQ